MSFDELEKMKKVTITFIFYENGFVAITGDCDFCKQFPCAHVNTEGRIHVPNLHIDIDPTTLVGVAPRTRSSIIKQLPPEEAAKAQRESPP